MHSAVSTCRFRGLSTPVASQNVGNSLRFPTVVVWVWSEGIMTCGWSGNGADLSPNTGFPCQLLLINASHPSVIGAWRNRLMWNGGTTGLGVTHSYDLLAVWHTTRIVNGMVNHWLVHSIEDLFRKFYNWPVKISPLCMEPAVHHHVTSSPWHGPYRMSVESNSNLGTVRKLFHLKLLAIHFPSVRLT